MCKTEQEKLWAGDFGSKYIQRNNGANSVAINIELLSKTLSKTRNINLVIKFLENIGVNLKAIRNLISEAEISAV